MWRPGRSGKLPSSQRWPRRHQAEPPARSVPAAAGGRKAFVPELPALAIAASVIAVVVAAVLLLTLRLGRILERLDARQQEREQQAIVERTRGYGQGAGTANRGDAVGTHEQSP